MDSKSPPGTVLAGITEVTKCDGGPSVDWRLARLPRSQERLEERSRRGWEID